MSSCILLPAIFARIIAKINTTIPDDKFPELELYIRNTSCLTGILLSIFYPRKTIPMAYEDLSRFELDALVWTQIAGRITIKALLKPHYYRLIEDLL